MGTSKLHMFDSEYVIKHSSFKAERRAHGHTTSMLTNVRSKPSRHVVITGCNCLPYLWMHPNLPPNESSLRKLIRSTSGANTSQTMQRRTFKRILLKVQKTLSEIDDYKS